MMIPKDTVIVFDFDGTIVETEKQVLSIMNGLRALVFAKPVQLDDFRRASGSVLGIFRHRYARFLSPFILHFVQKKQAKNMQRMVVEPGLLAVIRTLHVQKFRMGIITSNSLENVKNYLSFHHLTSLFDFAYASKGLFDKGEVIKELLNEQQLPPRKVIYIGDETRDVEAAKAAQVRVAAVTWGYQDREAFAAVRPDWLIDSPSELLSLFVKTPWWKRLFLNGFSGIKL